MQSQILVHDLTLRPATTADVDWGASIIFASGPALFSYVFASPPEDARETLRKAFAYPQHAFSYEHAQVVELAGQPAGIVLGYSGKVKKHSEEKVQAVMARLLPLRKLPRILVNLADLSRIKQDVALQDYFILSLSVLPEFRNRGIGTYLLNYVDMQAKSAACRAICLDVVAINTRAKTLFERNGYRVTCSKTSDRFEQMTRAGALHRMVKPVT
jgi:ribosomal protein S18 acetylase RimI-like enzyme